MHTAAERLRALLERRGTQNVCPPLRQQPKSEGRAPARAEKGRGAHLLDRALGPRVPLHSLINTQPVWPRLGFVLLHQEQ